MLRHNDFRSANMNCSLKVMHCKYLWSFAEFAKNKWYNWDVVRDRAVEQHPRTQTYWCITLEVITRTCFYAWNLWQCSVPQKSLSLIVQWGWVSFPFFFSINRKIKVLIVYNFCVSLKQWENEKKKSYAFTATFLVCITDVAQMMCMFYI